MCTRGLGKACIGIQYYVRLVFHKGNWHIYGQAYHLMLKTAMVFLNTSGKDWQLAAIPKNETLILARENKLLRKLDQRILCPRILEIDIL